MGTIPKELLRYWIDISPGAFCVQDLSRDVANQQLYVDILEQFVKEGVIDRYRDRRGWYIPKQTNLEKMDFVNADETPVDIWLPLGISEKVCLYPSSIVIVSGVRNAGKTALLLNIIAANMNKWKIHYFNSEMDAGELKDRLLMFEGMDINSWKFDAYARHDRFHDVIFPGHGNLNIIDFLEIHDEFYVMGKRIKEIHDRLNGALAIIAIQKNPGAETGLGGYRSEEVARLVLTLEQGRVKITKAKKFADPLNNPNGASRDFSLASGYRLIAKHGWYRDKENRLEEA